MIPCPNCGDYLITDECLTSLSSLLSDRFDSRAVLRHALSKMQQKSPCPVLTLNHAEELLKTMRLPGLQEQLDNLILWLARVSKSYGGTVERIADNALGAVGATDLSSLNFVTEYALSSGLISAITAPGLDGTDFLAAKLTFPGWERHETIQRGAANSRLAFMAMQFGNAETDRIYHDFLKPAVAQTGFELRRNDEKQEAGLIDDLMRIQIRQSRFVISDLTGHNNGAYWEAGYGEGLGKPVIYTCRRGQADHPSTGAHFDTNHHLIVEWSPDNMAPAVEKLKATIRATLPEDASLEDVLTPLG